MAQRFFIKNKEIKVPNESLRSPRTYPNLMLKSVELGCRTVFSNTNLLLCDQSKQFFANQENGSGNASPSCNNAGFNKEDVASKMSRGNPSSNVPSVMLNSPENTFSVSCDSKLLNSLIPSFRTTTCHRCGLFGSQRCSQCKQTYYCSVDCQKRDWSAHATICKPGTVTDFKNPSEFYIQVYSPQVLEHISKLSVTMNDWYTHAVSQEEYIPTKGEICVVKYSLDQTWCRVLVKEVDVLHKKAQVLYIDYGNAENVPLNTVRPLCKDIELFPPCIIKCCVAGIIPAPGGWKNDCVSIISPVLLGHFCSVTIIDVLKEEMTYFAVDLVLPSSGKHLDKVLLEKGYGTKLEKSFKKANEKPVENKSLALSSDVIPKVISVSVGDTFLGMVAHIQTPGDFFCQQLQNGCKLAELLISLGEYCDKMATVQDFCPAVGDLCCAQFTEDNRWYRVSVLAYVSEKTAFVGYVDFGNSEVLQLSRLRPIIPKLIELPVQAIKCTLAGVKPFSETWTSEATSVMKQLVQNKMILIRVVDKMENTAVVEITDESVAPVINVSNRLIEAGCAVTENCQDVLPRVETSGEIVKKERDWAWIELILKQTINVVVCVLHNPGEFYCQILKGGGKLHSFYCAATCIPCCFQANKGRPLLCDGRWYRALVKEVVSVEAVKVQFVDYGNVEEVAPDKLRQISSSFLKVPFQSVRCWLSGVMHVNKEWMPEATTRFQMYTAGRELQATVMSLNANGAGLELVDSSTGCPQMISEMLISEKLALKALLPKKDVLPDKSANVDSQDVFSHEHWKTAELPINEAVSVSVLEVISPDLFYAFPTENKVDQMKIHKLMVELVEYCNSLRSHFFRPKVGEACCAKFSGDGHWYRAVVVGIAPSEVKIAYADYGNIETLPYSSLLPIAACYLELPFQIMKCSLTGRNLTNIVKLSVNLLKTLLLNESVVVTVKGIHENIHAVSVEKYFKNGILNIADKLVMENLAKYNIKSHLLKSIYDLTAIPFSALFSQIEMHEQILFFLLTKHEDEDKFSEMKKLLVH
uniref:Tudor domain containing 1 n=1 Tax=Sphenodon punctatus TaxID=8508 RepID=A0A8D0GDC2_SPHPU